MGKGTELSGWLVGFAISAVHSTRKPQSEGLTGWQGAGRWACTRDKTFAQDRHRTRVLAEEVPGFAAVRSTLAYL
jgi:hypothetical protein